MINQDTSWPTLHQGYIAMTGFGKSQALYQNRDIPKRGARVVLWDIDADHPATGYTNPLAFMKALQVAIKQGRGFRIAWRGDDSVETFEWFCGVVLKILDGRYITYVLVEELADVSETAGKATPNWGVLLRRGRKYGARIHWTTQRSQEISKTAYSQTPIKWIGYPNENANVKALAGYCGRTEAELLALDPLQFFRAERGSSEIRHLQYKRPA